MSKELIKEDGGLFDLTPLVPIRNETVFTRYPIHRLEKHRDGTFLEIRENSENGDGKTFSKWKVSYNSEYGEPGPLAYKIDTLIVNRRIDEARDRGLVPALIRLGSLSEIAREVGTGDNNTSTVKKALFQNAFAAIVTKQTYIARDGAKTDIEFGGTRYALIFAGQVMPDGRKADAVYIRLQEDFRELLNNARTRPLDYDYLKDLSPGPQRLYELLSFEIYAAMKRQNGRAKLIYSQYCTHAPQKRYFQANRMRVQMRALQAPHITSGYITAGVEYIETTDSEGEIDWEIFYTPGRKAMVEYIQFNTRGGRNADACRLDVKRERPAIEASSQQLALPVTEPETALDETQEALVAEMVKHKIAPGRARELARDQSSEAIERAMKLFQHQKSHGAKIRDAGAMLADMIARPEKYVTPANMPDPLRDAVEKKAREAARAAEEQRIAQISGYMRDLYTRMQAEEPEAFTEYLTHINAEREKFSRTPMFKGRGPDLQRVFLSAYEHERGRMKMFLEFFTNNDCPINELRALIGGTKAIDIKRALDQLNDKQ